MKRKMKLILQPSVFKLSSMPIILKECSATNQFVSPSLGQWPFKNFTKMVNLLCPCCSQSFTEHFVKHSCTADSPTVSLKWKVSLENDCNPRLKKKETKIEFFPFLSGRTPITWRTLT